MTSQAKIPDTETVAFNKNLGGIIIKNRESTPDGCG